MRSRKPIRHGQMPADVMAVKTSREKAMPTIFEALIEIITNTDDAYENLNKKISNYNGDARLEYERGTKTPTIIRFYDRATGLTFEEMVDKLFKYQKKVTKTHRSFFGRGLKDVTALGDITVSSIKDNLFSEIKIDRALERFENAKNEKPTKEDYRKLGLKKNKSGTLVTVIIPVGSKSEYNPYSKTIIDSLPYHYSLSRILHNKNKTLNLTFVDWNNKKKETKLIYNPPNGKLVREEKFVFTGYNNATAKLKIYKLEETVDEQRDMKFRISGISVFGKKTCYQKNFLGDKDLERDPYAFRYYGTLECDHIDVLRNEWYEREQKNQTHTTDNKIFILDDDRIHGLVERHPFIKNHLFHQSLKIIRELINEDKSKDKSVSKLNDPKFKKFMDELMKDCFDQLEDIEDRDDLTNDKKGELKLNEWRVIPRGVKILEGDTKRLSVYTFKNNKSANIDDLDLVISDKDKEYIEILKPSVKLKVTEQDEAKLKATFKIKGLKEKNNINIKFKHGKQIKTECFVNVFINKKRDFKKNIEFEKRNYSVSLKKSENGVEPTGSRTIRIFAKHPELIEKDQVEAKLSSDDPNSVFCKNTVTFKVIKDTNYAVAETRIKGLILEGTSNLTVSCQSFQDTVPVKVVSKDDDEKDTKFDWDINEHRLAGNMSAWDTQDQNKLLIDSGHSVTKKYLGSNKPPFPYLHNPIFKMLLADILVEKFSEKRVILIARNNPIEYGQITQYKSAEDILQQATTYYDKARVKFVEKVHKFLIQEEDLK